MLVDTHAGKSRLSRIARQLAVVKSVVSRSKSTGRSLLSRRLRQVRRVPACPGRLASRVVESHEPAVVIVPARLAIQLFLKRGPVAVAVALEVELNFLEVLAEHLIQLGD